MWSPLKGPVELSRLHGKIKHGNKIHSLGFIGRPMIRYDKHFNQKCKNIHTMHVTKLLNMCRPISFIPNFYFILTKVYIGLRQTRQLFFIKKKRK